LSQERPPEPSGPSAGGRARIPAIWLVELFTPTTISSLIGGVRELTSKQTEPGLERVFGDPVEWITSDRRRAGSAHWRRLPTVRPTSSGSRSDVVDQMPTGIGYIQLNLRTLTSTVTALIAEFGLDNDRTQELEGILNREPPTLPPPYPEGLRSSLEDLRVPAVEEWRTCVRRDAASWLAKWFPGSFHRLAPGHLPAIEYLLTNQFRPWEPGVGSSTPDWAEIFDLDVGWRGSWQCVKIPSLRLQERFDTSSQPGQRHRLVLAASEQEFIADLAKQGLFRFPDPELPWAGVLGFIRIAYDVQEMLVRWSLTALIRELEEQITGIQDFADQASRKRSSRALADTQRQLLHTGIDSRIVVNDIIRYAQAPAWAKRVLDFTEVPQAFQRSVTGGDPAPQGEAPPTASLAESLRQGQIADGQRVSRLETDLREILSTSAELTSASENLRLQSMVVWLTVIATIVAIIAAAAAVIALTRS
jgi:hypothetical protein